MYIQRIFSLTFIVFVLVWTSQSIAQDTIDFNKQVKPILSDNCFACHGPDEAQRSTDFRLDQKESALSKEHSVIVPSDTESSLLIQRILSDDPDEVMPPSKHRKKLSSAQKQTLVKWIEQGAKWSEHWAFQKPIRTENPKVGDPKWPNNFVDHYILQRLESEKIKVSPVAEPHTLLRRLSFDLTGLPPSPDTLAQFQSDIDSVGFDEAYQSQVKNHLDNQHYGERMAVYWLDLVRYADTVGYHGDQNVSVSPFRDYVIEAFNNNMPFDQFSREQLAGDLIENPTLDQKIASGYNRLGMMSAEGGVQPEEYLNKYASDRVRTTSSVWLGVTLGCAECHDHKFDPLPTKEFYQFSAFFADIKEQGLYAGKQFGESIDVPNEDIKKLLDPIDEQIEALKATLVEDESLKLERQKWEANILESSTFDWSTLIPDSVNTIKAKTAINEGSVLASGENRNTECYLVVVEVDPGSRSFRLEALPHNSLPQKGPGRAGNGNYVVTELLAVAGDQSDQLSKLQKRFDKWPEELREKTIAFENATASFEQAGSGHPDKTWSANSAIDHDKHGRSWGWAVMPQSNKRNELVVQVSNDKPIPTKLTFVIQQEHGNGSHTLGHFRLSQSSAKDAVAEGAQLVPAPILQIIKTKIEIRSEEEEAKLTKHYISIAPRFKETNQEISDLTKKRTDTFKQNSRKTLVTVTVKPRPIRVLARGNWMDKSGQLVEPDVPSALGGKNWNPADLKTGRPTRMELANWIADPSNPMTSRVFVNRIWRMLLGSGLSNVLDDLGSQGEPPSHPELLDRLAIEFVDSNWDIKKLIRTIVLSETYRQSSSLRDDLETIDPENRLLARQSRFRLEAEFIRDHALEVSGLLVRDIGGKSVMPYQPDGLYRHLNFPKRKYKPSSGKDQYRRGLYTHWQRQFLHPAMKTFDAPSREECTAARPRSSTPLAALVMLNDPSYIEAAKALAGQATKLPQSNADKVNWIFSRTFSRPATKEEQKIVLDLLKSNTEHFTNNPVEAKKLLSIGQNSAAKKKPEGGKPDKEYSNVSTVDHAAWTAVCRAVMNMHEFILRK